MDENANVRIIFWNIHGRQENIENVIEYGIMRCIDIIAIVESPKEISIMDSCPYNLIEHYDGDKKRKIDLFIHKKIYDGEHYFREAPRFCVIRLEKLDINLVIAHMVSDLFPNAKDIRQTDISSIMNDVDRIEQRYSSKSTLIVGDLNINLFDDQMLSNNGFNARLFRYQMNAELKTIHGVSRDLYYNPMLCMYHDVESEDIARGTYYYDQAYAQWLCYDHILMKHALMDRFDNNTLEVVNTMGSKQLVRHNRIEKSISDHLPVYFEIKNTEDKV